MMYPKLVLSYLYKVVAPVTTASMLEMYKMSFQSKRTHTNSNIFGNS